MVDRFGLVEDFGVQKLGAGVAGRVNALKKAQIPHHILILLADALLLRNALLDLNAPPGDVPDPHLLIAHQ